MASGHEDVPRADRSVVCPLTGPIRVEGAEPGDLLVVDVLDVVPAGFGYTAQIPSFGFLRDEFPAPFLARWEVGGAWAVSPDLPGVRIAPARPRHRRAPDHLKGGLPIIVSGQVLGGGGSQLRFGRGGPGGGEGRAGRDPRREGRLVAAGQAWLDSSIRQRHSLWSSACHHP
jgi:hypothetical protein